MFNQDKLSTNYICLMLNQDKEKGRRNLVVQTRVIWAHASGHKITS